MDWKVQQPTQNEIEQFLRDVRAHFRASLETSEYENTSNIFHVTEAEATLKLLLRCEILLEHYATEKQKQSQPQKQNQHQQQQQQQQQTALIKNIAQVNVVNGVNGQQIKPLINCTDNRNDATTILNHKLDDVSYLDMSGAGTKKPLNWYDDMNDGSKSDKTFRCSTRFGSQSNDLYSEDDCSDNNGNNHNDSNDDDDDDDDDQDDDDDNDSNDDANSQGYDICQVTHSHTAETQKVITSELEPMQTVNCPYMDLPAGHLAIEKSTKYGQLQRIEKRLFFDQSKKYYCGVLNDWLLCYADGPTAAHPSITLYLKQNGIEIEHYGEGKRRELCFQITTADPNKKFLFQAINEVDAKEWIVAVETAIRGDNAPIINKHSRKLPTPPIVKRLTFMSGHSTSVLIANGNDCIYEEPSPLYQSEGVPGRTLGTAYTLKPPDLPEKSTYTHTAANRYEYDIPKCPPQPIKAAASTPTDALQAESETAGLLLGTTEKTTTNANSSKSATAAALVVEKIEFQSIVKDVHSKLSSQLSAGANTERLKKAAKKTYNCGSSDAEAVALTQTSSPAKEHKKQRKSNTPNASPQKNSNNSNNSLNNNHNSNSNSNERTAVKSWFFNRLNKNTSSTRSSSSASTPVSKCKQSEKENLLNSLEMYDTLDGGVSDFQHSNSNSNSSNPASPILKVAPGEPNEQSSVSVNSNGKSKVNLIIKEFEANAHLGMFNLETLAGSAVASLSAYCDSDCNNYEPIMTISTPPSSFMKKV